MTDAPRNAVRKTGPHPSTFEQITVERTADGLFCIEIEDGSDIFNIYLSREQFNQFITICVVERGLTEYV